ncbi:SUF system NifU family Fe-S cluster assembly protein [Tuanshanicoccus lijuaniae]|uniref:Fe-S cluster assembly sulfur transfer protein SufU n=1 Tax=Aerococcaceae bacterium zg-1292 TaxID=2774330 RepID=UPI0019384D19|nr:SUF system NifU family Fe-S cluster assembly protein [Aerococcaceae bacterium zg-1292]MBF6625903.1 SUF system NifU family Fe-S cluster assembly protein [Aerococcaceae bacterium zg-BR9]MBF6978517.1 SUF system NifU family Fe-S cluster assembly protein [Aerococcaceae bacterium zg-BR22]QQA37861.1 SUF system NifU family Fe-S cluster assembly protein [Aerococcaceae bacterium zg-1292]
MALNDLAHLYREVILDHAQHPRNQQTMRNATYQMELLNPTCGDAITVQLMVSSAGSIEKVTYTGSGCSISMASASMMTEVLMNKTLDEAIHLIEQFNRLVKGEAIEDESEELLKDAYYLAGVKNFPARYKCAVLAWKAVENAIAPQQEGE